MIYYNPSTGGMHGHAATTDGRAFVIESCGGDGHVYKEIDTTSFGEEEEHDHEVEQNSSRQDYS